MPEKIIIIDGSSYFFRAYYAIQRLSTSKGFPTNAIFGFIQMLLRVLEVEKPTKLAIAFDTAKPSFRKEIYKEYKANRERPPEDLIQQIPHILRAVDCFGVKRLELPGFEADDIIGTLTKRAEKEGYLVDIITGDKDLMQLVNQHVTLYDTMKEMRYDEKAVKEKLGVNPNQVVDYLALRGDASDNIPGVTGVGEKTATELLREFGSLDGIYQNLDQIKQEKRRETLKQEKEIAYLSQRLDTVDCAVPVEFSWEEMDYSGPKTQSLAAFLSEMEFRGLLKRLGLQDETKPKENYKKNYTTITTEAALTAMVEGLCEKEWLAIDTETTSLSIHSADLVGISLSAEAGVAYYIPLSHTSQGIPIEGQLEVAVVQKKLAPLFLNKKIKKIGQNLKYDLQILKRAGFPLEGIEGDTLLESYLIDPDQPHNLDALALKYLAHKNISFDEITKKGKERILFSEVSLEVAAEYACEDADVTWRLHQMLYPEVKSRALGELYHQVEIPLLSILASMEYEGILVDGEKLKKMAVEIVDEIGKVEAKIHQLAGGAFNVASPKQLSFVLFETLKLPVVRKTKTGLSTDEGVLQELLDKHEICGQILKFRELQKLKSTYVEGLLSEIHPVTHRVHSSFNQTVAATGRLSSSNPNLQNIPTGDSSGYDIRSVFIPQKGWELLSADYSQVELRVLADMSRDKELMRAFENDEDIHTYTGKLIFGKEKISTDERKAAKTINFGVVYGQTPYGLSQTLKISPSEAKTFIDAYFSRYSGVKVFFEKLLTQARKQGFVETKLGRRRYLSDLNSQNRMKREMAERAAINAPLQGTAADLVKVAMIRISRRLREEKLEAKMLLQVHDELVFEVPEREKKAVESLVRTEMETAMNFCIPLKVDIGFGKNWREAAKP